MPWVLGGAVVLALLLLLRKGGSGGPTLLQADQTAADQLQAVRYQAGGSAIASLAQAYSGQVTAQAQRDATIAAANAAAQASKYQADAQARAAASQSSSSIWGDIFDAASAIAVAAIG